MSKGLDYLKGRGFTEETISSSGLTYEENIDAIRIPYFDGLGRERAVRYRMLSGTRKYHSPLGTKAHLYNVRHATSGEVYIAEGEFDCLTLVQTGRKAVGVAGTRAFREAWAWLFAGSAVRIVYDGDQEGERAARELQRLLRPVALEVVRIPLAVGEDINSLFLKGELEKALEGMNGDSGSFDGTE